MFILEGLSKQYGTHIVLRDVNARLPTTGIVAVMGASGAGKSTLLRLLAFIERPDAGKLSLSIDGTTYQSDDNPKPWPAVTCVFQRQFLWPHLTVRENILLPLRLNRPDRLDAKLRMVTDLFDMSSYIDRYPNEVSVGQAQRGALARAFVLEPQMILMDEAHSALDLAQQCFLNGYMEKLRDAGVAIIVVTHSLDFARRHADQIIVIEDQTLAEIGPVEILINPRSRYLRAALRESI